MINIEPPGIYQNTLHWGVHHQLKIPFKKSIVYSSFPINKSEIIAITSNSIIRLEKTTIKETAPLNLSTAIFLEKQNVIVGVSSTTSEFFFIRPYDLSHHIETNVRTKQVPTFHILYSEKSSVLITSGKNIKIWNLKCIMPSRNTVSVPPIIEISLRNVFESSFEADLLNPPLFDYQREYLIIPESNGFNAYDMDCHFVKQMTKLSTSSRTAADISKESGNLITFESSAGASYEWNSNGTLIRKNIIGNSSVVYCRYLNDNFVVFLDSKNNIYLYDILTMKFFLCDQLIEKPSTLLLYYTSSSFFPTISVCFDNSIDFYEIVIPWKLWRATIPKPHLIQICRRKKRAARLLVHTDSEYIYFISPKTQQTVTSSTPSTPSKIIGTFYDRGMNSGQQRDQLFTITYDEKLIISSTSTIPCTEITSIDTSVAAVFECSIENKHYYGVATATGEIIVHDYDSFEPIRRYAVVVDKVLNAKYDDKFSTVLLFYEHEIVRVDITTGNVVCTLNLKGIPEIGTVFDFKDQLCLIGYKSGRISMISVTENEMVNMTNEGCVFHNLEVTGFSISTNFFISVSADQQMKFWSFSGSNIMTVTLPLPLYSVEVINGKRDIVVGTEKDLMLIEGRKLFCEKFEKKDDEIDNYNEKDDVLSDDSASALYLLEQQKQALRSAWKEKEELDQAKKGNRRGYPSVYKKKEMDDETRRKIFEKMMKMGDDSFTLNRIRERERKRFEDQKNQIQSEVDLERMKREKEKEEEEKQRVRQEEIDKLIQKQKEELENQKKKEEEEELKKQKVKEEEEDSNEKQQQNAEEESDNEDDKNNKNLEDEQKEIKESPSYLKFYESLTNNNNDQKQSERGKSPKKKKKKKPKNDPKNNKTNLVYVDENGRRYKMLDNGDWVDENGKIYHKNPDGTFVADDGTVWGGPNKSKGHFETADGDQINGDFAPEGTVWISPDGKKYTSLGDGRWIGPDGEIYTLGADGTFISADGKKIEGPPNLPDKWIGPDGKVYYRQPDGRYVAEDGTVWDKPMDGSAGGYFASIDGSKPGDTFVDENGNVYIRTSEGWIGPDGKLHRIGKDGESIFDNSKGQLFHQDGYNPDDIYIAPDGTVYKRTPSNRGWIGPDGKIYRLNKDGIFVAEDGTVMPLSNERLVWMENTGISYRPTYEGKSWSSSDGNLYHYELIDENENNNNNNNNNKFSYRFVSTDGNVWSGPTANHGRFAGKDLFDTPIQWIDHSGNVFKAASKDGNFWITSRNRTFERQENGRYIEKVDSEEKVEWEGPGKQCNGNWVNGKGQIIESLGGYWISPDNKIYAATKSGYVSIGGILYKPVTRTEAFVSQSGEKWNGLGQITSPDVNNNGYWVDANGDIFRPIDKSGNWEGPNGDIYSPQTDGTWVCQSNSKVWKGPPFFSARKYFINNHSYWLQSFHSPNIKPIPYMPFNIGQRPNTPLYKVPPLLYPPFKSKYKAFQTKSPRRKRPPVVYSVPPPNIVCDPSQIVKLIIDGNTQLIEVAKRLGLGNTNKELDEAIIKHESRKSDSHRSPFPSPRKSRESQSPRYFSSDEKLPKLVKNGENNSFYDNDDKISCSASLPSYSAVPKLPQPQMQYSQQSQIEQSHPPPLPSIHRRNPLIQMDTCSDDSTQINREKQLQPPPVFLQRKSSSPNYNNSLMQYNSDSNNPNYRNSRLQYNNDSSNLNYNNSRLQYNNNSSNSNYSNSRLQYNNNSSNSNYSNSRLQYNNNSSNSNYSNSRLKYNNDSSNSNYNNSRLQYSNDSNDSNYSNSRLQYNNDSSSPKYSNSRLQNSSNSRVRNPLIPLDSEQTSANKNVAINKNASNAAFAFSSLETGGGVKRADGFGAQFDRKVPLLNFGQNKEGPMTALPKTERTSKRRLHTAYLSRAYQLHLDKPQNQTSREIVNPLIVRSMVKPKLSVPQQLFKPKRNS